MERLKHFTIIIFLAIVLPASAVQAKSPSLLLQECLYAGLEPYKNVDIVSPVE